MHLRSGEGSFSSSKELRAAPAAVVKMDVRKKKIMLPLIHVLQSLPHDKRVIILSHLDDKTRDAVLETVTTVLRSEKLPFKKRRELARKLAPYKKDFRYISDSGKSQSGKRRKLSQLGAGPMQYVLRAAVPLLLNIFPRR
jgi:hypothetical protein